MAQGFYPGQTEQNLRAITAFAQGTHDPSVVPTVGKMGTLFVQLGTLNVWQKQDNGRTTNWTPYPIGGGGSNYQSEFRTLTAPEAAAKEITLATTPTSLVTLDIVGGCVQYLGLDYTVTGDVLSWDGLGLDGLLSAGDMLVISYAN